MSTEADEVMLKLPIGKFSTALPKGYTTTKHEYSEIDCNTLDYSDDQIIFTTLPARFDTVAVGANGWSECLMKGGKDKRWILSRPGFPCYVPSFDPPRYHIGPSKHGGKGLFAACDIKQGDLIFAERPVIVVPHNTPIPLRITPNMSQEEIFSIQLIEYERVLQYSVDRMLPQDREAFFELWNSHTEDGSGPIFGRIRTNGIGINLGEDGRQYSGTFLIASRMNHSCVRNVYGFFDESSFSFRFHAVRPIKAGEELYISYVESTLPRAERQSLLAHYGFKCNCTRCSNTTSDDDILWNALDFTKV
ncbi:hypothetical protein H0H93_007124 [Arthromyces matolae]|nr:hypothetical protein H0H93_007124 [Arthromyces matolae]